MKKPKCLENKLPSWSHNLNPLSPAKIHSIIVLQNKQFQVFQVIEYWHCIRFLYVYVSYQNIYWNKLEMISKMIETSGTRRTCQQKKGGMAKVILSFGTETCNGQGEL